MSHPLSLLMSHFPRHSPLVVGRVPGASGVSRQRGRRTWVAVSGGRGAGRPCYGW